MPEESERGVGAQANQGAIVRGRGHIDPQHLKQQLQAAGVSNVDEMIEVARQHVGAGGAQPDTWYVLFGGSFVFVITDPF